MNTKRGVIFLDGTMVVVGIYGLNRDLRWTKIYYRVEDLSESITQIPLDPAEMIEKIADTLLFGIKLNIKDWKIISRNLPEESFNQISAATKLKIKNLNLAWEQRLVCEGLLNEVFA